VNSEEEPEEEFRKIKTEGFASLTTVDLIWCLNNIQSGIAKNATSPAAWDLCVALKQERNKASASPLLYKWLLDKLYSKEDDASVDTDDARRLTGIGKRIREEVERHRAELLESA